MDFYFTESVTTLCLRKTKYEMCGFWQNYVLKKLYENISAQSVT